MRVLIDDDMTKCTEQEVKRLLEICKEQIEAGNGDKTVLSR